MVSAKNNSFDPVLIMSGIRRTTVLQLGVLSVKSHTAAKYLSLFMGFTLRCLRFKIEIITECRYFI
jgi:hypothetical protein